ncbi:DUF2087 domain-containing protein [Siculibacillus lacustris]|uniref:DUF2087 domain-containing protein n=1 Tax=Siculibacillus lacustris TaxID=1549641 RepID=A0A4Q9VHM8_9HYPH|nr:DUF2087 domain-containing protein [Siculibacillus lacustris]TBW33717.1 DUF2087 domain-containing protein [Siculibacillus lacustris]
MSRSPLPFAANDIAGLARALERQLGAHDGPPGHVEMLNMLARAGGFANYQHFRAQAEALDRLATPTPPAPPIDTARLTRIAGYFDGEGKLMRWPGKANHRVDCLWVMWSRLPARLVMHEREINRRLRDEHRFGDHALLRRELVDGGLMWRTLDGTEYRRIESPPPPEALALIRLLARRAAPQGPSPTQGEEASR